MFVFVMEQGGLDAGGGVGVGLVAVWMGDAEEFAVEHAYDVTAERIGIAVGVQLGLNVGALGPLPELGFEVLVFFSAEQSETLLFDADATGNKFAAAEGDDVVEEVADIAEFVFGVLIEGGGLSDGRETDRDPVNKMLEAWCGGSAGG